MTNSSIYAAFERMWQHIVAKIGGKADIAHEHDDLYYTKIDVDTKVENLASASDVTSAIATHNSSANSHEDIRITLAEVKEDVDAFFKDASLTAEAKDTLKEIQDYIDSDATAAAEMAASIANKADADHGHNYYGVCSTAAGTVDKTVDIAGFKLEVGAMVLVKFTEANSASSPTLNVSGTGAKPMYRYGTTALSTGTTTTGWYAGSVQVFVYDGTGWIRDYWNNSTYSNAGLGQGYATCSTAAATVAKTATCSNYALATGGIVSVKFTNAVPANATLNIASKGAKAMYYRGVAITGDVIKAGDTATFIYSGTYYHLLSIDRWQEDIVDLKEYVDTQIESIPAPDLTAYETKVDAQTKYDEIVSAKADWNQNDENAIDYVKNRTHYKTQGFETIFQQTVLEPSANDNEYINCASWYALEEEVGFGSYIPTDIDFVIIINGVEYECASYDYYGITGIGDSRLGFLSGYEDENGEWINAPDNQHPENVPFLITHEPEYFDDFGDGMGWGGGETYPAMWSFYFADEALTNVTIEIKQSTGATYHTIDERYIPDTIARTDALDEKMNYAHPRGTGSFSMNRRGSSTGGSYSSTLGQYCIASGNSQHAQGKYNIEDTTSAHIVGNGTSSSSPSNAHTLDWNGNAWFAGDVYVGSTSGKNRDSGSVRLATMNDIPEIPDTSNFMASTDPVGTGSFSMNRKSGSEAGNLSVTLGNNCIASGLGAYAEGYYSTASGDYSHAEGYTTASGSYSHAEGQKTIASGSHSHAEGCYSTASGSYSHAEGYQTIASRDSQHAQGKYNIEDTTSAHIVGNGTAEVHSNAHTLDWSGNAWFAGDVYVGSTSGTNKDAGSVKLLTMNDLTPISNETIDAICSATIYSSSEVEL